MGWEWEWEFGDGYVDDYDYGCSGGSGSFCEFEWDGWDRWYSSQWTNNRDCTNGFSNIISLFSSTSSTSSCFVSSTYPTTFTSTNKLHACHPSNHQS